MLRRLNRREDQIKLLFNRKWNDNAGDNLGEVDCIVLCNENDSDDSDYNPIYKIMALIECKNRLFDVAHGHR